MTIFTANQLSLPSEQGKHQMMPNTTTFLSFNAHRSGTMRQGNHFSDTTDVGQGGLEVAAMAPDLSERSDSSAVLTPVDFPPSPPSAMSNLGALKSDRRPASATMDSSSAQSPQIHDRTGNISTESLGSFEIIPRKVKVTISQPKVWSPMK